jgi:hypothetical protein
MTFENTLLIDDMPHKSLFNPPFSAMFFETFYGLHNDTNYLLQIVFLYSEYLHSSKMWVYKFVKLNHFGSIIDVLPNDPQCAKLIVPCSIKCDETFCNIVQSRSLNKKR